MSEMLCNEAEDTMPGGARNRENVIFPYENTNFSYESTLFSL